VLVLHSYPPVPCLHTFELGLRELAHDVVCVGVQGDYGSADAWRDVDPGCSYEIVARDAELADIFRLIGGAPDWVFYLRPNTGFLPRGLAECPVPTVAWLEDEFKNADTYHHLGYYFDLVGTAYPEIQESFQRAGHDNWVCFNYFTASWLTPVRPVVFSDRSIDVSFVGHSAPKRTRLRCLELEKLCRLTREGIVVRVLEGPALRDMMAVYERSKIVFQHSGQGPPNLTYRVGEAMAAGAMVLAKRPNRVGGLMLPLVEGEHIVYYDDFDQAAALIHHYIDRDDERREIAEGGHRYVTEGAPWTPQVQAFLDEHVYTIDGEFRARRRERLARFGVDPRREQIDRALYFSVCAGERDQAGAELLRIEGWGDDPYVRSLYAAASAPDYLDNVKAVLARKPGHLLTVFNYAERVFASREAFAAKDVLAATEMAIGNFTRANRRELDAEDIEGLLTLSDLRLRRDITNAYVDLAPGPKLRERLHGLLLAQLYKNRGIVLYDQQEYGDAHMALSRAAHGLAEDGYLLAYLARAAWKLGRTDEAATHFADAIESAPHMADVYCEFAELLRELGRPADAVALLEDAALSYLFADEPRIAIHVGLAEAYFDCGDNAKARDTLRQGSEELESGMTGSEPYQVERADDAMSAARINEMRRTLDALAARARGAS